MEIFDFVLNAILLLLEAYTAFCVAYILWPLFFFPLVYGTIRRRIIEKSTPFDAKTAFIVLIPAHNEAKALPFLLRSIREQAYPPSLIETLVVADNCSDDTAAIAGKMGFQTLVRTTDNPSSKDQAMQAGLHLLKEKRLLESRWIAVVDADSALEPGFLAAMDRAVQSAQTPAVFQSFRSVHNRKASAVSAMDAASEALRQWLGLGVRDSLGMEATLHGTGTVFPALLFEKLSGLEQAVFADDKRWRIHLFAEKGVPVRWVAGAHLSYESVVSRAAFGQQRSRWVAGQIGLLRQFVVPLLLDGLRKMDINRIDFACSILQLPRSLFLFLTGFWAVFGCLFPNMACLGTTFWICALLLQIGYWSLGLYLAGVKRSFGETLETACSMAVQVARLTVAQLLGKKNKAWGRLRE